MRKKYEYNDSCVIPLQYKLLIFIPLILFIVFGNYHGLIWLINDICLGIMFLISLKVKVRNKKIILFCITFSLILIIMNIMFNGFSLIVLVRLYDIFKGLIYLRFINYLINKYNEACKNFILNDLFYLFNLYFIINIPIIIKQIILKLNRDNIAGLIGNQGTHVVLILWIVIIVLNCYKINNTKYFSLILGLLMIEVAIMTVFSVFSDNTAFYFIGLIVLVYSLSKLNKAYKIFKPTNIVLLTIIFFIIFNFFISSEKAMYYLETKVKVKIEQYTNIHNSEVDNEERVEMILYGLKEGNGYYVGDGIGIRYEIMGIEGKDYNKPPVHINICDLSAIVMEGGILLAILIMNLYYFLTVNFYRNNKIYILILIFLLFSYAKFISDERMIFLFSIFNMIVFYLVDQKENNRE